MSTSLVTFRIAFESKNIFQEFPLQSFSMIYVEEVSCKMRHNIRQKNFLFLKMVEFMISPFRT